MKTLFQILFLVSLNFYCYSQVSKEQKRVESLYSEAKSKAEAGEREKSIDLLTQILKFDPTYYMAHFALADIYHETGQADSEIRELKEGLKNSGDRFPPAFKFLSQALYKSGEYDEAFKNIKQFAEIKKELSAEESRFLACCSFAEKSFKNPVPFQPVNVGKPVNTSEDEYWPCLDAEGKKLIFTRLLKNSANGSRLPFPQEDLFQALRDSNKWQVPVPLDPSINSPDNEGAQSISADGKLLFFTACGRSGGQGSCDLYMSVRKNNRWSEPVNLGPPVNTNAWETQPSISADGHFLYFTSNRKGGKGKMDIWRAEKIGITPDGLPVYGKVANMESINTPGDELSPFIHPDGRTLYFASDYWPGMGGKDLFRVKMEDNRVSVPLNLGYPINTKDDEEGLVVETGGENAYFTSNTSGFGGRDIFSFQLPPCIRPEQVSFVKGRVFDTKTNKAIFPDIRLHNLITNQEIQRIYPVENEGEFLMCLPAGKNYGLSIEKEGYLFCSRNFNLENSYAQSKPLYLSIGMDPIEPGKTTVLNNLFFDTDSHQLKPESEPQLKELVDFLNKNRNVKIEISGHTDNVGSEKHNLELSSKRADSVVSYLKFKGISPERLQSKGYGYTKSIADNATEEGRTLNRRTEIRIL